MPAATKRELTRILRLVLTGRSLHNSTRYLFVQDHILRLVLEYRYHTWQTNSYYAFQELFLLTSEPIPPRLHIWIRTYSGDNTRY